MDLTLLDRRVDAYCAENRISGMLRVTRRGEIVWRRSAGFADPVTHAAFSEASMFSFYSLSKPFCAMGLLKLCDRGLVDLEAHPGTYVPEAAGFDRRVTLRQLLTHTSGLPDCEQIPEFAAAHRPGYARFAREHVKLLSAYPQFFEPGTGARYENINFLLCALVIEAVTGEPYGAYMRREVFGPLSMRTAVVDDETRVIPHRVTGCALRDGEPVPVKKSHDWMLGAGDIVGTVDDAFALNRAIRGRLLLKPETWAEALTPSPLNSMGMGCTVSVWHGKRRITHNGGHTGFRTLHILLPDEDFDLIFLSNAGYGDARAALSELVHAAFFGDAAPQPPLPMDTGYIPAV